MTERKRKRKEKKARNIIVRMRKRTWIGVDDAAYRSRKCNATRKSITRIRLLCDRESEEELIAATLTIMPPSCITNFVWPITSQDSVDDELNIRGVTATKNETLSRQYRDRRQKRRSGENAERSCVRERRVASSSPVGEARSFQSLFRLLSSFAFPATLPTIPSRPRRGEALRFVIIFSK